MHPLKPRLMFHPYPNKKSGETWTAYLCIILSAILGFLIQPIVGKQIAPFYGGSSASWIGAMLFFQGSLLLGYLWAYWLVKQKRTLQITLTILLFVVGLSTFHLPNAEPTGNPTIWEILWRLSLSCLPSCVLLFSCTILLTGWLSSSQKRIPFYIYALSNGGSLCGLLAYTFWLEPTTGISDQTTAWRIAFAVCGGLLCWRAVAYHSPPLREGPLEKVPKRTILLWISLSALPCICMLGTSHLISGEFGSTPLSWVGPFGLYLLAFSITFSGLFKKETLPWVTLASMLTTLVFLALSRPSPSSGLSIISGPSLAFLLLSLFFCSTLVLSLLYQTKPSSDFSKFYVAIAVGGVVGGLASTFVIPWAMPMPIEVPISLTIAYGAGLYQLPIRSATKIIFGFITPALIYFSSYMTLSSIPLRLKPKGDKAIEYFRDIHGHISVTNTSDWTTLTSHSTVHGSQKKSLPRTPTLYYSRKSPPARILSKSGNQPPRRVGIIGLGAGTLAAYSSPRDHFIFWDIDPKTIKAANQQFTYLKNSQGKTDVIQMDGRIGLQQSEEDFDAIIVDAYTGDAIPSQLITKEALEIYKKRLSARKGLLLVHHTTRYSDYSQILCNTAHTLGLNSVTVDTFDIQPQRRWEDPPSDGTFLPDRNSHLETSTTYTIIGDKTDEELRNLLQTSRNFKEDSESLTKTAHYGLEGRTRPKIKNGHLENESPLTTAETIRFLTPSPSPVWTDNKNSFLHTILAKHSANPIREGFDEALRPEKKEKTGLENSNPNP